MKRRLKVEVWVAILICVSVVILIFLNQVQESPSPDFLVYNVKGELRGKMYGTQFLLTFTIQNNGTANATNVVGTAKFERNGKWNSVGWNLNKAENMIGIGEEVSGCYAIFYGYSTVPSENFVITVSCDEGVLQDFNVTIS